MTALETHPQSTMPMPSPPRRKSEPFETSLGPVALPEADHWSVDLSALPIFRGLSVLSRALTDIAVGQARAGRADIRIEREIRERENPELRQHLGVGRVRLCAEPGTATAILAQPDLFGDQLRSLFGTLQRARYRDALIPRDRAEASRALVFQFDLGDAASPHPIRYLLEFREAPLENAGGMLYVSLEDPRGRRVQLESIPHLEVEDVDSRAFIAGSTRIAHTWREGLRREAERGRLRFIDRRTPRSHLFRQLDRAGLDSLQVLDISWGEALVPTLVGAEPRELDPLLKKILLALEDRGLRQLLEQRATLRLELGETRAYLDLSQHARVLNVCLGQPRQRVSLDDFLQRMPATVECSRAPGALAGVKVFLIHHITAEVLGLIAALRALGCRDLVTLFVAYAGDAPREYLDPLLDLPPDEFRAAALACVPEAGRVEGAYRLSTQYSPLACEDSLRRALGVGRPRFFEAMQRIAKPLFVEQLARAEAEGQRCLLIEDGGYLAPALNRACLKGTRVGDFAGTGDDDRPLRELLQGRLAGSVEHTRNGHDRLAAVESQHERLAFPAFSIAVSRLKREVEAREVAISILNAVDNVLHAIGLVASRRHCVVLGASGAIGAHLVAFLGQRLERGTDQLAGVDIRVSATDAKLTHARRYRDLPEAVRRRTDLILGVAGASALRGEDVEAWLREGLPPRLILASGSTKTEEFADVSRWMEAALATGGTTIAGLPARVTALAVRDSQSGRIFGHRYRFQMDAPEGVRKRELLFLANLTPVNFLFYGVPTELIDEVLAQLLGCARGLLRRSASHALEPRLHAVDAEIDADGEALSGS